MTIKDSEIQKALEILNRFERQVIDPREFGWRYLTDSLGISRATLWRYKTESGFRMIYNRFIEVKEHLKQARKYGNLYSLEKSKRLKDDQKILKLEKENEDLRKENDRLREQLTYAASVARRKNLNPTEFFKSPFMRKGLY